MAKKKEEIKVIAPTNNPNVDTLEETVTKEVKPATETINIDDNNQSKGKKVISEIKSFLILCLVIGVIALGTWYWYTHMYDADKNKNKIYTKNEPEEYKVISYVSKTKNNDLIVVGNYLIEKNDNYVEKIMDLKAETIYENKIECNAVYLGIDNNLYFILEESGDYENSISISRLDDDKIIELDAIAKRGVYYSTLLYDDGKEEKLLGFVGDFTTQNDELEEETIEYIHLLNDKNIELKDISLFGSELKNGIGHDIITNHEKYIITKKDDKYGIYDIKNEKNIIEPSYDMLKKTHDGNYVAVKNEKAGIIDINKKILVDFEYDFIDINDNFYVVSKNNKLAIMNDEYNLITDFAFDYQYEYVYNKLTAAAKYDYYLCCQAFNTFKAYKVKDNYILITNNKHSNTKYSKNEAYIIHEDGSFETIEEKDFVVENNFIYALKKDKKIVVYDNDLKEKYTIDLSRYDANNITAKLLNENTIVISIDGNNIYYDYENGESIKEILTFEKDIDSVNIKYEDNKLIIKTSDKNESTIDIKQFNYDNVVKLNSDCYYYVSDNSSYSIYVSVYKED